MPHWLGSPVLAGIPPLGELGWAEGGLLYGSHSGAVMTYLRDKKDFVIPGPSPPRTDFTPNHELGSRTFSILDQQQEPLKSRELPGSQGKSARDIAMPGAGCALPAARRGGGALPTSASSKLGPCQGRDRRQRLPSPAGAAQRAATHPHAVFAPLRDACCARGGPRGTATQRVADTTRS